MSKALRSNKRAPKVRPCEWARAELLVGLDMLVNVRSDKITPLKLPNPLSDHLLKSEAVN